MWQLITISDGDYGYRQLTSFASPTKGYLKPLMQHKAVKAWRLRDRTGWCASKNWPRLDVHYGPALARLIWNEIYGYTSAIEAFGEDENLKNPS